MVSEPHHLREILLVHRREAVKPVKEDTGEAHRIGAGVELLGVLGRRVHLRHERLRLVLSRNARQWDLSGPLAIRGNVRFNGTHR